MCEGWFKKICWCWQVWRSKNISDFTIRILNDINWFYTLFAALQRAGIFTPPFWYRSEMTTFFKRFPARRNRTVHSGLILELFAQWVIYFDWKKKFAGLGGVKGGLREYILHSPPRGSKICFLVKKNEFLRTKNKRYTRVVDKRNKHKGTGWWKRQCSWSQQSVWPVSVVHFVGITVYLLLSQIPSEAGLFTNSIW